MRNTRLLRILLNIMTVTTFFCMFLNINIAHASAANTISNKIESDIIPILTTIALFVCVGKLIHIGIMYMMTGANERSNAKTAAVPWIIGAVICGGYAIIGKSVTDFLKSKAGTNPLSTADPTPIIKDVGNQILSTIMIFAIGAALGMLIYIGIKYMLSGAQGMAKVKTTLLPWLIGAMIVAGASGITNQVWNIVKSGGGSGGSGTVQTTGGGPGGGTTNQTSGGSSSSPNYTY